MYLRFPVRVRAGVRANPNPNRNPNQVIVYLRFPVSAFATSIVQQAERVQSSEFLCAKRRGKPTGPRPRVASG